MTVRRRAVLSGVHLALCLALPRCARGAEKGNLKMDKRGSTVIVTGKSGNFRVVTSGVGNVPRVQWKDRFEHLREIAVRVRVRWGHMYDLYSLNEPMLHLRFKTTGVEARRTFGPLLDQINELREELSRERVVTRSFVLPEGEFQLRLTREEFEKRIELTLRRSIDVLVRTHEGVAPILDRFEKKMYPDRETFEEWLKRNEKEIEEEDKSKPAESEEEFHKKVFPEDEGK